jgi:hypothetical protein
MLPFYCHLLENKSQKNEIVYAKEYFYKQTTAMKEIIKVLFILIIPDPSKCMFQDSWYFLVPTDFSTDK